MGIVSFVQRVPGGLLHMIPLKSFFFTTTEHWMKAGGDKLLPERFKNIDSMILLHRSRILLHSDAALTAISLSSSLSKVARLFLLLPRSMRDWLYKFLAVRRRILARASTSCVVGYLDAIQGRLLSFEEIAYLLNKFHRIFSWQNLKTAPK